MKQVWAALVSGLVFGLGLGISGMTQADKVIGFLDITDAWDPSLAFVMLGAIAVHVVLYRVILRRGAPVFAGSFGIPTRRDITPRLVAGSAMFGVGWALGGYCPGPGLVSVMSGAPNAVVFVLTLIVGMNAFRAWDRAVAANAAKAAKAEAENKVDDEKVQRVSA